MSDTELLSKSKVELVRGLEVLTGVGPPACLDVQRKAAIDFPKTATADRNHPSLPCHTRLEPVFRLGNMCNKAQNR